MRPRAATNAAAAAASAAASASAARSCRSPAAALNITAPPRRCAGTSGCVASRDSLPIRCALLALKAHCVHRSRVRHAGQLMLSKRRPRAAASRCAASMPTRTDAGRLRADHGCTYESLARVDLPAGEAHWASSICRSAASTASAQSSMGLDAISGTFRCLAMSRARATMPPTQPRRRYCTRLCAARHVACEHSNRKW